jgi:glycosyltransferase involved in cell wall biosynthesis
MLIRAFDLLLRAVPADAPEPKLVLVGDGPARIQLEQMCRDMSIKAVFEGHLSGERLAESYASADIFAYVILPLCIHQSAQQLFQLSILH